jgi:hypothetical protein
MLNNTAPRLEGTNCCRLENQPGLVLDCLTPKIKAIYSHPKRRGLSRRGSTVNLVGHNRDVSNCDYICDELKNNVSYTKCQPVCSTVCHRQFVRWFICYHCKTTSQRKVLRSCQKINTLGESSKLLIFFNFNLIS